MVGATTASAHHAGTGGIGAAGGIFTIGAGTLSQGDIAFSAFVIYDLFRQLSNSTLLANVGNDVHGLQSIDAKTLVFSVGVTSDFTVSFRAPWVRHNGILEGVQEDPAELPAVRDRGGTSGFGDVTILGQYRFLNRRDTGTQAAALFGLKAPTGRTGVVDRFGDLFEAEFQPGSGSWDGLFGLAFSQQLVPAWSFHANVLGILASGGTQDTNLGDRFLYNAALTYNVFGETAHEPHSRHPGAAHAHAGRTHAHAGHTHAHTGAEAKQGEAPHSHVALDAFIELNGEWHGKQRTAGISDPNSGGNTIYLSPGLRLTVEDWSSYLLVGFPVVHQLNGTQAAPSLRVMAGISVLFAGPQNR